ncbi:glycoside hydrolase family 11 protein [Ruminococcus flavefaciens]|uniref:glycoside hydrolase family 11 protein n=2 Tax=Ruminococcus flavefaciens TaxID=1265 RepID=UPI0012687319|nr:glycoside hydrolase family 11 protein [Ruminococcus flavefaciens]
MKTFRKIIGGTVSALMIATSMPVVASAADQQTRGNIGGFDYEMWNQNGQGQASMNPGAGSFTCSWSNIENFLARMGKNYDSQKKNYKAFGNIVLTYDVEYTPRGNSYMCVYGWTRNPLMEYYIVEGWGDWRPPGNDGEVKGTVTANGNTYDIRKTMRYNQPSLDGTATFPQYWSVRQTSGSANNQTNYMKGTIDVTKHFDAWSAAGLDMSGTLYEVSLNIEGYRSNGSANVKSVNVTQGGSSDNGAQQQNNDWNQQNNNQQQNNDWNNQNNDWSNWGQQNGGFDWNNQNQNNDWNQWSQQNGGFDWNNQGGFDWNNQGQQQNNGWDWGSMGQQNGGFDWNNQNNNQQNAWNGWDNNNNWNQWDQSNQWNNQQQNNDWNQWNNQNQNNDWNNWGQQNNDWNQWNNQNQNNDWNNWGQQNNDWNQWNNQGQNNDWNNWNNQNNNWDWNNQNNNQQNTWNGWDNNNNWNQWDQNNQWNNQQQNNGWDWNNQNQNNDWNQWNNQNQNNDWNNWGQQGGFDWNSQGQNNDWNNWGGQNNDWNNQNNNQQNAWNGWDNNNNWNQWNNQNQNNDWNNQGQQGGFDWGNMGQQGGFDWNNQGQQGGFDWSSMGQQGGGFDWNNQGQQGGNIDWSGMAGGFNNDNNSNIGSDPGNGGNATSGLNAKIRQDMPTSVPAGAEKSGGCKVEKKTYNCKFTGGQKSCNVILPPNYNASKQYPVMYVLHGIGGDENSMVSGMGVQELLAGLTSSGQAEEMIIVLPSQYTSKNGNGGGGFGINQETCAAYDNFLYDISDSLIPFIEANYSVKTGRENRAITGFSMGGREAIYIGLMRPDLFGYVGGACPAPGITPATDMFMTHPGCMQESEMKFRNVGPEPAVFMITGGTNDSVVGTFPKQYSDILTKNGVEHVYQSIPGGGHGGDSVKPHLYTFMRYAFK